jgi:hypothetical protein
VIVIGVGFFCDPRGGGASWARRGEETEVASRECCTRSGSTLPDCLVSVAGADGLFMTKLR